MLASSKIIAFVPTTDPVRSKAFYGGVLGLRFVKDDGFALVFDANGIMVRVAKGRDFKPAQYTILGWEAKDIEKELPDMIKKGVRFEQFGLPGQDKMGIWTAPNGDRVAWFKDPDGNTMSISQHV